VQMCAVVECERYVHVQLYEEVYSTQWKHIGGAGISTVPDGGKCYWLHLSVGKTFLITFSLHTEFLTS
jgi:hypothetical protein